MGLEAGEDRLVRIGTEKRVGEVTEGVCVEQVFVYTCVCVCVCVCACACVVCVCVCVWTGTVSLWADQDSGPSKTEECVADCD